MIDPGKCTLEDYWHNDEYSCDTYYFRYPRDEYPFRDFRPLEEYGNVVSFCISFTTYPNRTYDISVSPTVEFDDGEWQSDVDWRDMIEGLEYDEVTLRKLEKIAAEAMKRK